MHFQKEDYEQLAEQVVDFFVEKKVPLNSSILKFAQENDFNPEQVKRLVELSNVKAFLKIFQDEKNKGQDVEFDVADSDKVLKGYYSDSKKSDKKPATKTASTSRPGNTMDFEFEGDLPDLFRNRAKHAEAEEHTKVAHEEVQAPKVDRGMLALQLDRVAKDLTTKIYENEQDYVDGVDKLASEFAKLYGPDYVEFEKDALCLYGQDVTPILDDIRHCLRWERPYPTHEKVASMKRLIVDAGTAEMRTFHQMVECKREQYKYAQAVKVAKEKLKRLKA